jgi:sulfite reductase alpha subunit-like flavoprotein
VVLLCQGAHVYVCGDGKHMAPGVHEALTVVVAKGEWFC